MKIFEIIYMENKEVKQEVAIMESTRTVTTSLTKKGIAKSDILRVTDVTESKLQCDEHTFINKIIEVCRDSQKFDAVQIDFIKDILK